MATEDLSGVQLHLVDSTEKAREFLEWLGQRRPHNAVSVDTETGELPGNPRDHALSPWHGRLRLVQVGDGQQGWSIPWDEWKGVFYEGMDRFDGPIICHNIAFEARWFAVQSRWDLPWHRAHDTMIMAHIIDPLGSGALKRLAALHIDGRAVALQDTLDAELAKNGWTWGTVPTSFQPYWSYGALDCVLTTRLWEMFYEKCGPDGPYHRPYELEMATRRIVTRMEINGARVDLDYSRRKYDELTNYANSVKDWAKQTYGGTSITSNVQLVRLFESLGAEITEYTPTGQKSCTKDQLKMLIRDGNEAVSNLADIVLKQRKADKLANTYFSNFLTESVDGFVHPSVACRSPTQLFRLCPRATTLCAAPSFRRTTTTSSSRPTSTRSSSECSQVCRRTTTSSVCSTWQTLQVPTRSPRSVARCTTTRRWADQTSAAVLSRA